MRDIEEALAGLCTLGIIAVARARQQQIDAFRVTPTNQIVEIGWTPRPPAQAAPGVEPRARGVSSQCAPG
jgi:hypothetical protein